jgi:hypothetical protein
VPAPKIDLLTTSTATNVVGGFGTARTTIKALQITLPGITIPAALRPATGVGTLSVKAVGDVLTQPLAVSLGTMQDTASFRPSVQTRNSGSVPPGSGTVANPPGTSPLGSAPMGSTPDSSNPNGTPNAGGPGSNPQLPRTGLPAGAALLALGLVGAGLVLARARRTA